MLKSLIILSLAVATVVVADDSVIGGSKKRGIFQYRYRSDSSSSSDDDDDSSSSSSSSSTEYHPEMRWVTTWAAAMSPAQSVEAFTIANGILGNLVGAPMPSYLRDGFVDRTVRMLIRTSAAADDECIRIVLDNSWSLDVAGKSRPVRVDRASWARAADGFSPAIVPGSALPFTFNNGQYGAEVCAGCRLRSDELCLGEPLAAGTLGAISLYFADTEGPVPSHWTLGFNEPTFIGAPGERTLDTVFELTAPQAALPYMGATLVSALEVRRRATVPPSVTIGCSDEVSRRRAETIVFFGDSLFDGDGSSYGLYASLPEQFARRVESRGYAVANRGISGNQMLSGPLIRALVGTIPSPYFMFFGVAGLARIDIDAVDTTSPTHIVVQGVSTNDIQIGLRSSADELIAGAKRHVEALRTALPGVRVHGVTMIPCPGCLVPNAFLESVRQPYNAWMRSTDVFDTVTDFDALVRDPANPALVRADLVAPDGIHLNNRGYAIEANAFDTLLMLNTCTGAVSVPPALASASISSSTTTDADNVPSVWKALSTALRSM